jgi:PPP family 3-phenylpropionic acid transporter
MAVASPAIIVSHLSDGEDELFDKRMPTSATAPVVQAPDDSIIIRKSSSRHVAGTYIHDSGASRRRSRGHSALSPTALSPARPSTSSAAVTQARGAITEKESSSHPADAVKPVIHESEVHFHEYVAKDPNLILHKAVYFIWCMSLVCFTPYVALILEQAGASKQETGVILSLRPLFLFIATPIWTRLADAGHRRAVLVGTMAFAVLSRSGVEIVSGLPLLSLCIIAGDTFAAPILSLLDAAILSLLEATSSTTLYGNTRLAGSIGWGAFAPVIGLIADKYGLSMAVISHLIIAVPCIVLAYRMPVELEKARAEDSKGALKKLMQPDVVLVLSVVFLMVGTLRAFISTRQAGEGPCDACVLVCTPCCVFPVHSVFLQGMLAAIIGNFQFLFLKQLGAPQSLMGLALTFSCVSEVPVFYFSTRILKRFGVVPVLFLSLVCYAIRMFCYYLLVDPVWTLPVELLHGFTYALGLAGAIKFMHECVPHGRLPISPSGFLVCL